MGNADLLAKIEYEPALPELMEAARHDLDHEMRYICMMAIGKMGVKAYDYADGVRDSLLSDRSFFVRRQAANTGYQRVNASAVCATQRGAARIPPRLTIDIRTRQSLLVEK